MASAGPGTPAVALSTLRSTWHSRTLLGLRALLRGAILCIGIGLAVRTLRSHLTAATRHHLAAGPLLRLATATLLASTTGTLLAHGRLIATVVVVIVTESEPADTEADDQTDDSGAAGNSSELSLA